MTRFGTAENAQNRHLQLLAQITLCIVFLFASAGPAMAIDEADLQRRAEAAARHLIALQTEDGHFLYEFDFLYGRFMSGDNIVRQAAAGYALGMMHQFAPNPDLERALQRALKYDVAQSIEFGGGKLVSGDGKQSDARAGATALAILADLHQTDPLAPFDPQSPLASWVTGLIALQADHGGFRSNPAATGRDPYADGESWLALAQTVQRYPELEALQSALTKADSGLMDHYTATPDLRFSHWGLMAAAQRLETTGDQRFAQFLRDHGSVLVHQLAPEVRELANSCAMVEGLTAAASALLADGDRSQIVGELADRAVAEMTNTLRLQIEPGQQEIAFGDERFYHDPKIANFAGAFLNSGISPRMRVDATQHCLSALIGVSQLQRLKKE